MSPPAAPIQYEERLVVFVDLLGWADLVDDSVRDADGLQRVSNAVSRLRADRDFLLQLEQANPEMFRNELGQYVTLMSDSVVITVAAPTEQRVHTALRTLSILCTLLLLREKLVMRGGIVLGPVFHDQQVVVGPALNRAVALERSAYYPRILVDETARDLVGGMARNDPGDGLLF